MKRSTLTSTVMLLAAGVLLSWGGMLYAFPDDAAFEPAGILISLAGYGIFPWAAQVYENIYDEELDNEE